MVANRAHVPASAPGETGGWSLPRDSSYTYKSTELIPELDDEDRVITLWRYEHTDGRGYLGFSWDFDDNADSGDYGQFYPDDYPGSLIDIFDGLDTALANLYPPRGIPTTDLPEFPAPEEP